MSSDSDFEDLLTATDTPFMYEAEAEKLELDLGSLR